MSDRIERDDEINPDSWTQKELLKHVYREVLGLKGAVSDIENKMPNSQMILDMRNDLVELTTRVNDLESNQDIQFGKNKATMYVVGIVFTLINLALTILKFMF